MGTVWKSLHNQFILVASGRIEKQYQFERIQMISFEGPRVALENSDLYLTFYFSFFFPKEKAILYNLL